MGLLIVQADIWNTKKPGNRLRMGRYDMFLLNTNRMSDIHDMGNGDADFLYSEDPDDRRDSPGYIEADIFLSTDALEDLRYFHDLVPTSKFHTFGVYPDMDITQTPVPTDIEWEDIAYVYYSRLDIENDTSHMVYYRNTWERVECIVDENIIAIWLE
jgi:hypothetical protein